MPKLKDRLTVELGNWQERLPRMWKQHYQDVELNFDAIDPDATLNRNERIWPQESAGPAGAHVFKALKDLSPAEIRVVIFGNDPFTRLEQATGRSFEQGDLSSWTRDFDKISPSLKSLLAAVLATDKNLTDFPLEDRRGVYSYSNPPFGKKPLWLAHRALELVLKTGQSTLPSPKQIFGHWASQGVL